MGRKFNKENMLAAVIMDGILDMTVMGTKLPLRIICLQKVFESEFERSELLKLITKLEQDSKIITDYNNMTIDSVNSAIYEKTRKITRTEVRRLTRIKIKILTDLNQSPNKLFKDIDFDFLDLNEEELTYNFISLAKRGYIRYHKNGIKITENGIIALSMFHNMMEKKI